MTAVTSNGATVNGRTKQTAVVCHGAVDLRVVSVQSESGTAPIHALEGHWRARAGESCTTRGS